MSEIHVKNKENVEGVTVQYSLPVNISEAVEKYGDEQALAFLNRSVTLAVQALVRSNLDKSQEEVQALVDQWVPGVRSPAAKKSPLERATAALAGMDAEALQELLRKVKEKAKAAQA